jgi:thiol-disulfide isomerase/thioredoxin
MVTIPMASPFGRLRFALLIAAGVGLNLAPVLAGAGQALAQAGRARPWLGISMDRDTHGPGVLVGHVVHGSPADKGGIREGDRIVRVGGVAVASGQDVVQAVAGRAVGEALDLTRLRDGHEVIVRALLAEFPSHDEAMRMDLVGAPAPTWSHLDAVTGAVPASVSDLKGQVLLLDFWATWCAPCRIIGPKLSQLQTRYGAQGLTVLGVSSEDGDDVRTFIRQQPLRYSIAVDPGADTARRYGVVSLPTLVAIDRRGIVRDVFIGYDAEAEVRLEKLVRTLLAEPVPH